MSKVAIEQIALFALNATDKRGRKDFVYPAIFLAVLFALDLHTAYTRNFGSMS